MNREQTAARKMSKREIDDRRRATPGCPMKLSAIAVRVVATYGRGVLIDDVTGPGRHPLLIRIRRIYSVAAFEFTTYSLENIARGIRGAPLHNTVIGLLLAASGHDVAAARAMMESDGLTRLRDCCWYYGPKEIPNVTTQAVEGCRQGLSHQAVRCPHCGGGRCGTTGQTVGVARGG